MIKSIEISRRIDAFINQLQIEVLQLEEFDSITFDPISIAMVKLFFEMTIEIESENKILILSSNLIGKKLRTTKRKVQIRLRRLARYSILRAETPYIQNNKFKTLLIVLNPILIPLWAEKENFKLMNSLAKIFAKRGIDRLTYENDIQGFEIDCPYGKSELVDTKPYKSPENRLYDKIRDVSQDKVKIAAEAKLWRSRSDKFVELAAKLWIRGQSERGFGTNLPSWAEEKSNLTIAAKRERNELCRIFQNYGGIIASVAWYVYNATITITKDKTPTGQPVYSIVKPYSQFVTQDRKPSGFSKHIDSIIKSEDFIRLITTEYELTRKEILEKHFIEVITYPPRWKSDIELLGYEIGNL